jgi:hypothetical protein
MVNTQRSIKEPVGEPFSERLRLIRFRMEKERFRLSDELRLIPPKLWLILILLFAIAHVIGQVARVLSGPPWPELSPRMNILAVAGAATGLFAFFAVIILLVAYVNRDAKRREMNSTLWTILVVALLPAYFVTGFIIYFLLRDPLPLTCPQCSSKVSARFNFCPECKFNLRPTCPQCAREVRTSDRFCSYCAFELTGHAAKEQATSPAEIGSIGHGV